MHSLLTRINQCRSGYARQIVEDAASGSGFQGHLECAALARLRGQLEAAISLAVVWAETDLSVYLADFPVQGSENVSSEIIPPAEEPASIREETQAQTTAACSGPDSPLELPGEEVLEKRPRPRPLRTK